MDFEQAAKTLSAVPDEAVGRISDLIKQQTDLEDQLVALEEETKDVKKKLRKVQETQLPEAIQEFGISEFKMADGSKIEVKKHYAASIPKKCADEAFAWLNDNEFGDIIKNTVTSKFVRGEEADAEALIKTLTEQNYTVETKKWVEPQTLKAFAKERIEAGDKIPTDLFGIYITDKAKITRKD